jgi:DNA polymerase I
MTYRATDYLGRARDLRARRLGALPLTPTPSFPDQGDPRTTLSTEPGTPTVKATRNNALITTEEELLELIALLEDAQRVAIDTETYPMDDANTALDPRRGKVRLISIAAEGDIGGVVDADKVDPIALLDALRAKTLIAHNASFLRFLMSCFEYEHSGSVVDTMLSSQLLEGQHPRAGSHSLESVVRRELGIELDKEPQAAGWGGELSSAMLGYAVTDAQVLLLLAEALEEKVRTAGLCRVAEIEHRALPAIAWMQTAGVPFDTVGWKEHLEQVEDNVRRLKEMLSELAPAHPQGREWNWNSPQQVKKVFALAGIELPNTREETLSRYDLPLAKLLLEYRKPSKTLSSFGSKLLESVRDNGRMGGNWRQIGTETGRMSCSRRNLQQFPSDVRRYVRAPEGRVLVWADYSQAEIRILASTSGDPTLVEAFREGRDPYKATAANIFGVSEEEVTEEQRGAAKVLNFSFIFGATAFGIAKKLGKSVYEGNSLRERYFAAHPAVFTFLKATIQKALDTGEARTLTGRLRRLGNIQAMKRKEAEAVVREAMNHPMQGSCADGLKLALALLYERRHECPGAAPIIALHDEIVVECDEEDVDAVAAWLEKAMVDGLSEVLALGASKDHSVPVEVAVKRAKEWVSGAPWSPPSPEYIEEEEPTMDGYLDCEVARVRLYIDYRDQSVDNYPQIEACEECAEALEAYLSLQGDLRPGEAAWCEECGEENAAAKRLLEQEREPNHI